jgi:NAD(P)H-hydrate epimerase
MERITTPPPLPDRPREGHKGIFGRVLVVGGNDGMIGAPVLAATSALRMGAGLVQLAVPRSILSACLSITPELIGIGLGKAAGKDQLLEAGEKADAVVIGPGLGRTPEAMARVQRLVRLEKPMVIDADGLNLLSDLPRWPTYFKAKAVLTPHPGEMARLGKLLTRTGPVPADEQGRTELAAVAAEVFGQVVLLKGERTIVTDGRRVYVNTTGDSSLSKAGAGDVLCGVIATLLAQRVDPFDAAVTGAYLHGRAGELAGEKLGRRCVLARDVIDTLAEAIAEYERGTPPPPGAEDAPAKTEWN